MKDKHISVARLARLACYECFGGSATDITGCDRKSCPLWGVRSGSGEDSKKSIKINGGLVFFDTNHKFPGNCGFQGLWKQSKRTPTVRKSNLSGVLNDKNE